MKWLLAAIIAAAGLSSAALAAGETLPSWGLSAGSEPRSLCVYDSSASRPCVQAGLLNATTHAFSMTSARVDVAAYGAIAGDATKAAANATAFVSALGSGFPVICNPELTYYVQKIVVPTTAPGLSGCHLTAGGTYAGSDAVISVTNNMVGFLFDRGTITVDATIYPTTDWFQISGSTNPTIQSSTFAGSAHGIHLAGNTNETIVNNVVTSYKFNAILDDSSSVASSGVLIQGNDVSGGTDTGNVGWNDQAIILLRVNGSRVVHNRVRNSKFWSISIQGSNGDDHSNDDNIVANNLSINSDRECITVRGYRDVISGNVCRFDAGAFGDYCMSFGDIDSYFEVTNNICYEPNYTGLYFNNAVGGIVSGNLFNAPTTTRNGSGWAMVALDGTSTGMTISNNAVSDFHSTYSWTYWKAGGSPSGNYLGLTFGPSPISDVNGNSFPLDINSTGYFFAFTPTLTCASGALTTASATGKATKIGYLVTYQVDISITDVGTCGGALKYTLPSTAASNWVAVGRDRTNGNQLDAFTLSGTNIGSATNYNNTDAAASGHSYIVSGQYQTQ